MNLYNIIKDFREKSSERYNRYFNYEQEYNIAVGYMDATEEITKEIERAVEGVINNLKEKENKHWSIVPSYIEYYYDHQEARNESFASGYSQAIEDLEKLLKGEENVESIR
jgi:hypothetical protein